MLVDLHFPTDAVQSTNPVCSMEQVLSRARARGLDGICLAGRGHLPKLDWARLEEMAAPMKLFGSVELETELGPLMWLPPSLDQVTTWPFSAPSGPGERLDAEQLLRDSVHGGGAIVMLQPLQPNRGQERSLWRLRNLGIHALEVWNGRRPEPENRAARKLAHRYRLVGVGGSGGFPTLGSIATLLGHRARNQADLVRLLWRGDAWMVALRS